LLDELEVTLTANPDSLVTLYVPGIRLMIKLGNTARAAEMHHRLLGLAPKTAVACNEAAWVLATDTDLGNRDPALAVELAQKAIAIRPEDGGIRNTLGVAECRAGDFKQAIADLQKSMDLRNGGDGMDWFPLAIAHWQLGERAEARKCYDQGIRIMDEDQATNEKLLDLRAEAEQLMSLSAAPASKP
jgi:tetratricopeptide (TPR) repeat protein